MPELSPGWTISTRNWLYLNHIIIKKGRDLMPLPKNDNYTIDDIYALPDGQRAELIDGQIYDMAPPSPFHQKLVMELSATLRDYIKKNGGSCKVYPTPF